MVEAFQRKYPAAAVRIANPFITSYHWESNPRRALKYIKENMQRIVGRSGNVRIVVVAHSAGAAVIASIAHEYPEIAGLLLINPAKKLLGADQMIHTLGTLENKTTVVFGGEDPSIDMVDTLRSSKINVHIVRGADHNFSGKYLNNFIDLPTSFLP